MFMNFSWGSLVWDPGFGIFGLVSLVWAPSTGISGLGSAVWDLRSGVCGSGHLVFDLYDSNVRPQTILKRLFVDVHLLS